MLFGINNSIIQLLFRMRTTILRIFYNFSEEMPNICCIKNCGNGRKTKVKIHNFPSDKQVILMQYVKI